MWSIGIYVKNDNAGLHSCTLSGYTRDLASAVEQTRAFLTKAVDMMECNKTPSLIDPGYYFHGFITEEPPEEGAKEASWQTMTPAEIQQGKADPKDDEHQDGYDVMGPGGPDDDPGEYADAWKHK